MSVHCVKSSGKTFTKGQQRDNKGAASPTGREGGASGASQRSGPEHWAWLCWVKAACAPGRRKSVSTGREASKWLGYLGIYGF